MATKRPTRTKSETTTEFNTLAASTKKKDTLSAKEQELTNARNAEVRNNVADLNVEKALNGVTKTNLEVNKALSAVTEQLVETTRELETVKAAVQLEREELELLHGKDLAASALDDLIAEYNEKKAEIEADHVATRAAWVKEDAAHGEMVRERNDTLAKLRAREEHEYQYKTQQDRRKAQDEFNESIRLQQIAERDRREKQERDWSIREATLALKEQEVARLTAEVGAFPAKLDGEVKKAEAIVGNTLKRDYEHKTALAAKDFETSKIIAVNEIASLRQQLEKANATVAEYQTRLAQADNKVAEIASKALDAASGRQALAEVSSMVQRDNGSNGRKSS